METIVSQKSDFQVAADLVTTLPTSDPIGQIAATAVRSVLGALKASADYQTFQVAQAMATPPAPPADGE